MTNPLDQVEDAYGLTSMQEGMLYHYLLDPKEGVFLEQFTTEVYGALDIGRFQDSWATVYKRHPALRSLFVWDGVDVPLQVVSRDNLLPWEQVDWSDLDSVGQEQALQSYLISDRQQGHGLDRPPVARMFLAKREENAHQLVWTFFHGVLDGWSLSQVIREVLQTYEAKSTGALDSTPPKVSFGSYVEYIRRSKNEEQEQFWRNFLSGIDDSTKLTIHPSGDALNDRDKMGPHSTGAFIPECSLVSLNSFAQRHRLTLNTLIHAAWALLLHRYCDADDVVFGSTVSGRTPDFPDVEKVVGCCINTLPFRTSINQSQPLVDWLTELQQKHLELREHELTSLADIKAWAGLGGGGSLFDSIVVVENLESLPSHSPDHSLELRQTGLVEKSNFPLALQVVPEKTGMALVLNYDATRFSHGPAAGMLDHFKSILSAIPEFESDTVAGAASVSLKDAVPRQPTGLSGGGRFLDRFKDSVMNSPDAIAVRAGGTELTYLELTHRALSLAKTLSCQRGVDSPVVGLFAEPSTDLVIGILGIMLADCAYLPLDPDYPPERLETMVMETGLQVVVVQEGCKPKLPDHVSEIYIQSRPKDHPSHSETVSLLEDKLARQGLRAGERLAYVIFTSGSSGVPKGVGVSVDNLASSLQSRVQYYKEPVRSFLLLSSFSFDSSVAGIFWTLATGGKLVVASRDDRKDLESLSRLIERHGVSHTLCLPSLYALMLEYVDTAVINTLNTVIVAGETCPRELCIVHNRKNPDCALHNEYGPTEASVWSSVYRVPKTDIPRRIPIGESIPGTQILLLDTHKRPVPHHVPGEIHICSPGVVSGYINDTGKQGDFWSSADNTKSRYYATGDLAFSDHSGCLTFLGRRDDQVKVRGHRIELGEVESAIKSATEVADAVVLLEPPVSQDIDELLAATATLEPAALDKLLAEAEDRT